MKKEDNLEFVGQNLRGIGRGIFQGSNLAIAWRE
jgi:hypothetical protein